jgi:hypothetical protein
MNESIAAYTAFLWEQFQYDWSVFSNPWLLYTIVPALLYLIFFVIKWYILLAPITIPLTVINSGLSQINSKDDVEVKHEKTDKLKNHLKQILGGGKG